MNNTKSLFDFIYLKVALCPQPALSEHRESNGWLKSLVLISVHSWFNFVFFVYVACPERSRMGGESSENVTKMLQLQNEPKTNPNEPNFSEAKPHSKPKNQHFRQIYENLFMQNEPNGML